jgi:DNA-binding NarL/FixJ family response regulator
MTQPGPASDATTAPPVLDDVDSLLARGDALGALRVARGLLAMDPAPVDAAPARLAAARSLIALGRDDEAIDELVAIQGARQDVEAARIAALLALLRVVTGRSQGSVGESATALDAGLRIRDPGAVAAAWQSLAFAYYYRGEIRESVNAAEEHLAWSRESGATDTVAAAMLGLGISLMHADRFEDAAAMLDGAHQAARTDGVAVQAAFHRAFVDIHAGRWEAATTIELLLSSSSPPDWLAGLASGILAVVLVHQDRIEDAARALEIAPAVVAQAPRPMQLWASMLMASASGRHDRAVAAAERLVHVTESLGSPVRYRLYGPDIVRVLVRGGDLVSARVVARSSDIAAQRAGLASVTASARLCRGLLDRDTALISEAVELFEAGPRRFEAAISRSWLAEELLDAGRTEEAIENFDRALTALTSVGAHGDVRRVEHALRRLGRRPGRRGPRARATTGIASLTPTELHVAELVGHGLSNAEIAERLVVSARTVEAHVAHAFTKLGVGSRTQLALAVRQRDS